MTLTTRTIEIDPDLPDPIAIAEAARVLARGGLVAFPTETVYGLGADATSPEASARIFEAKGRPPTNPLIVHVDGFAMAAECVASSRLVPRTREQWERWWPGPVTFVHEKSAMIPEIVTAGSQTVGVRMPRSPIALALIEALGRPIAAPSANRSTGVSPTRAWHVLKDLGGRIELILDGGPTGVGLESTVVDMTGPSPRVLRVGPVPREEFERPVALARPGGSESGTVPSSPGQSRVHYAPRTPTYWVEPTDFPRLMLPGRGSLLVVGGHELTVLLDCATRVDLVRPDEAGSRLYEVLHILEGSPIDWIVVVPPPAEPEWEAIRDRLWRASRPLVQPGQSNSLR